MPSNRGSGDSCDEARSEVQGANPSGAVHGGDLVKFAPIGLQVRSAPLRSSVQPTPANRSDFDGRIDSVGAHLSAKAGGMHRQGDKCETQCMLAQERQEGVARLLVLRANCQSGFQSCDTGTLSGCARDASWESSGKTAHTALYGRGLAELASSENQCSTS